MKRMISPTRLLERLTRPLNRPQQLVAVLVSVAFAAPLAAQDYWWDQIDELGIKFRVHKKLKRIPLKLGSSHPNLRARYEPVGPGDFINGRYGAQSWDLRIYEFAGGDTPTTGANSGQPTHRRPGRGTAETFAEFVRTKGKDPENRGNRVFPDEKRAAGKEHKKNKAAGERFPYRWWIYRDRVDKTNGVTEFAVWTVKQAAVYDFGTRQIAVVTSMPAKDEKLASKYRKWSSTMVLSLSRLKDSELDGAGDDEELFEYAQTPERKKAVEAALANVAGLDTWEVFATPHYVVLCSWPAKSSREKQRKYLAEAHDVADDMNRMRELYQEYYPPYENMNMPYSVLRICSTMSEFRKYSVDAGPNTIGWFSPGTKELVLFAGQSYTKTVAFHEGWHQYADAYFAGALLHRWFDEGTGDFFGSFTRKGRRWDYETSKMRKVPIKTLVNTEKIVPLEEIVTWNTDKFYGPNAPDYYAQGYAMIDFLHNAKGRRGWDKSWDDILENYRTTMLETRSQDKAVKAAFDGVDWDDFTKSWIAWVKGY